MFIDEWNTIVFSCRKNVAVAESVRENLPGEIFVVDIWTEAISGPRPLDSFLKKLLYYDVAILVLGDDDRRFDPSSSATVFVRLHALRQNTGGKTITNRYGRNFLRFNSSSGVAEDFDCLV